MWVKLSILIGEKSLYLVGFEPATFRLQASTSTSRPLVPPSLINSLFRIYIQLHHTNQIMYTQNTTQNTATISL